MANDTLGWFDTPDSGGSDCCVGAPVAPPPLVRRDAIPYVDASTPIDPAHDRAAADDADTMAVEAEAQADPPRYVDIVAAADETFDVLVARGASGQFGIIISDDNFIEKIKPGSRADEEKELLAGDEITGINGVELPPDVAVATMLDAAEAYYLFTVRRRPISPDPPAAEEDPFPSVPARVTVGMSACSISGASSLMSERTTAPTVPPIEMARLSRARSPVAAPTTHAPCPVTAAPTANSARRPPARARPAPLMPFIRKLRGAIERRGRRPAVEVIIDAPSAGQNTPTPTPVPKPKAASSLSSDSSSGGPGLIDQLLDRTLYVHECSTSEQELQREAMRKAYSDGPGRMVRI